MDWPYFTLLPDGTLADEDGDLLIGEDGKPLHFSSPANAEDYLEANDIRGTVR